MRIKETLHSETKRTIKLLIITLMVMIVALTALFLVVTSENAQNGYALEQEKLKNENLKSQKSDLDTKITKSSSFSNIEENDKIKKMQEPEKKEYVTRKDNSVK